jgi:nitrite reductase (NO-forming)
MQKLYQARDARAPAPPEGSDVNITLTTTEVPVPIADGVTYQAWTFDGMVPGPVLRVRQGQLVHFKLVNRGNRPHSIDFHAAQTPWNVNYQPIDPGKHHEFTWRANFPGVFVYHCSGGVHPLLYHLSNGMYGAIIVDPPGGFAPAREYVLVQSEFYVEQYRDSTYALAKHKVETAMPDYVLLNGYFDQYMKEPLQAKVGERVRLFVVNAGPSRFSAFHIIGTVLDDVYIEGNPQNHIVGTTVVTIPPAGSAIIEVIIPEPGQYPVMTHALADMVKGAMGLLEVTA